MSEELSGNILIIQTGTPTPVTNAILAEAVSEALNHGCIEEIYGCLGGFQGLLSEDLIDLAEESQQTIRGLRHTPGAALGSSASVLKSEADVARALRVLEAHHVRFVVVVGDVETLPVVKVLEEAAKAAGYALVVMGVPHHVGNDLPVIDHCPGYGSAIKRLIGTVLEASVCAETFVEPTLTIIEAPGSTGWIGAGAMLAKRRNHPEDAPHLLCLPEVAFSAERFVEQARQAARRTRHVIVVTTPVLKDSDGNYIQSASGTAADYLVSLASENLGVRVELVRLGNALQVASGCLSKCDVEEAGLSGAEAVRAVAEGHSGQLIGLMRGDTDTYSVQTSRVALTDALAASKPLPQSWIVEDGAGFSYPFYKYAMPLIQGEWPVQQENGLLAFVRLNKARVGRKLEAYAQA